MFITEQEMSVQFEKYLKANFGNAYLKECKGLFGVPDFVYYSKQKEEISIISFELKLKNWKRAVKQAFRYKCFSNIAYVVLPSKNADAALTNIVMFERYNVGLAIFDQNSDFEILHKPRVDKPYSETMNQKLVDTIGSSRKKSKNVDVFLDNFVAC
jgi:hypothetical protein